MVHFCQETSFYASFFQLLPHLSGQEQLSLAPVKQSDTQPSAGHRQTVHIVQVWCPLGDSSLLPTAEHASLSTSYSFPLLGEHLAVAGLEGTKHQATKPSKMAHGGGKK